MQTKLPHYRSSNLLHAAIDGSVSSRSDAARAIDTLRNRTYNDALA